MRWHTKVPMSLTRPAILRCCMAWAAWFLLVAHGLSVETPTGRKPFRIHATASGLENIATSFILQDRSGIIWLGMEQVGLARFDGMRFRNFGIQDGLPSGDVVSLHEDPQGNLWVGTAKGLARWDGVRFQAEGSGLPPQGPISALATSPAGLLWVGTPSGLYERRANGDYHPVAGWPGLEVSALHATPTVVYSAGVSRQAGVTTPRLMQWRGNGWTALELPAALQGHALDGLAVDRNQRLWVRSSRALWVRAEEGGGFQPVLLPNLHQPLKGHLALSREGWVMVPTNLGLYRDSAAGWSHMSSWGSASNHDARHVMEDREGDLWIATGGLAQALGGGNLEVFTREDGLPDDTVFSIFRDAQGTFWIGTVEGAVRFQGGKWHTLRGTESVVIRTMVGDAQGRMLLAGSSADILRHDPLRGGLEHHPVIAGQDPKRIFRMLIDRSETLWVATESAGLLRANATEARLHFVPEALPGHDPSLRTVGLWETRNGQLWCATATGLFMRWQGTWKRFGLRDGLKSEGVNYIRELEGGDMVVAYAEPLGLTRFRLEGAGLRILEHLGAAQGLASDKVLQLGQDLQGRLWVGTGRGVDVLSPTGIEHYGISNGLPAEDANAMAILVEPTGDIWQGFAGALARFRTGRQRPQAFPSPPVLLSLDAGGQPLNPMAKVPPRIRPQVALTVHFTFPTYALQGQVVYEVRMLGLEDAWRRLDSQTAVFPALGKGHYRFQVRARLGQMPWSEAASYAFEVLPRWFETWWFRSLMLLAGGISAAALVRWRLGALRRRNAVLEQLVQERTAELSVAKEAAERASAFKSIFIANTSHELRTPLNAILGFVRLMCGGGLREEDRHRFLRIVLGSGENLLQIVNDLLDLSKIEAGRLEIEAEPFDVREVVESALVMLGNRAQEKGLDLVAMVDAGLPARFRGDGHRLRQMLVNLMGNALKFTAKGHVAVRVHGEPAGDHWNLEVRVEDTGPGVPPEVLPRLFSAFTQAEGEAKRLGTGLGLSITRQLAQLMGGTIVAESELGKGSRFGFTLPLEALAGAPEDRPLAGQRVRVRVNRGALREQVDQVLRRFGAVPVEEGGELWVSDSLAQLEPGPGWVLLDAPLKAALPPGVGWLQYPFGEQGFLQALTATSGPDVDPPIHPQVRSRLEGRVLVADDNPFNRTLVEALLQQVGLDYVLTEDGQEALERFQREPFDLVILDGRMPRLDGPATLRALRAFPKGATVPIVLFSASMTTENLATATSLGFDDVLLKPAELDNFRSVVCQRLSKHRELQVSKAGDAGHALDDHRLARLWDALGGEAGMEDFVSAFVEDAPARLKRLRDALAREDRHQMSREGHDLKSNAASLGLQTLASLAADVEHHALEATHPQLLGWLETLEVQVPLDLQALKGWMQARSREEREDP